MTSANPKSIVAVVLCAVIQALLAQIASAVISVSTFSSPAGLDLTTNGSFVVAENTGSGSPVTVGGLNFTGESYFVNSPSFGAYFAHDWGGAVAFADPNLNNLLKTIRFSGDAGPLETSQGQMIANIPVTIGQGYKLQLIFWEGDSSREDWNITIEGETLSDFDPLDYTGNVVDNDLGVLVSYSYIATDTLLNINIASVSNTSPTSSVMLNALTLEVPEPGSAGVLLLVGCVSLSRMMSRKRR